MDIRNPGLPLLMKLGSIAVHAEEYLGNGGHLVDLKAMQALLSDPEVVAWRKAMTAEALLPLKRG